MAHIQSYFDQYGESHQNQQNKLIHWIFVPTIYFSGIGLLWIVKLGSENAVFGIPLNAAMLVSPFVITYYMRLNRSIAIGMALKTFVGLVMAYFMEVLFAGSTWMIWLAIFVISWIFQFIGHGIEGKKPSFAKDLQFFLIGPAWILAAFYRSIGIKY